MMRILNLTENSKQYTSNVFMVLGAWNTLSDITTLVDVGSDATIINKIEGINTGLGKKKIDQVVLTHSHSDHSALLSAINDAFHPRVCAFNSYLKGITQVLNDGDMIRIGEQQFEVFHITSHSYDSICLFGEDEGILFAGDTSFPIEFENDELMNENTLVLARLQQKDIRTVFYGHGPSYNFTFKKFKLIKK